jgi:hypothetical protein
MLASSRRHVLIRRDSRLTSPSTLSLGINLYANRKDALDKAVYYPESYRDLEDRDLLLSLNEPLRHDC